VSELLYAVVVEEGKDPARSGEVYLYKDAIEVAKTWAKTLKTRQNVYKLIQTHTFAYETCPGCQGCGKVEVP
jgi:hypothetical protein